MVLMASFGRSLEYQCRQKTDVFSGSSSGAPLRAALLAGASLIALAAFGAPREALACNGSNRTSCA